MRLCQHHNLLQNLVLLLGKLLRAILEGCCRCCDIKRVRLDFTNVVSELLLFVLQPFFNFNIDWVFADRRLVVSRQCTGGLAGSRVSSNDLN